MRKISKISAVHYFKLIFRSVLFVAATVSYIVNRVKNTGETFGGMESNTWLHSVIWVVFMIEMLLRFFPSKLESMGCQKQFAKNYKSIEGNCPQVQPFRITLLIAVLWILLNAVFGILYFVGIFDRGILLLISLAFSACDMICILFFCPFQTWFMKNKCCTACRIYNWDYAMMFTPLIFVKNPFTWSILFFALALLIRWEVTFYLHPERFSESTNACLSCANCEEKLCQHKKQLQGFLKKHKKTLQLKGNSFMEKITLNKNK